MQDDSVQNDQININENNNLINYPQGNNNNNLNSEEENNHQNRDASLNENNNVIFNNQSRKRIIFKVQRSEPRNHDNTFTEETENSNDSFENLEPIVNKRKKDVDKIESMYKAFKTRVLEHFRKKLNFKVKEYLSRDETKKILIKKMMILKLDQKFLKTAKISVNKNWLDKPFYELYLHEFRNKNKNTEKNTKIIKYLEDFDDAKGILDFLKNYNIKNYIGEYLNSRAYRSELEKLALITENKDDYIIRFDSHAHNFVNYFEKTPANRSRIRRISYD
jgi:hypothetical protein